MVSIPEGPSNTGGEISSGQLLLVAPMGVVVEERSFAILINGGGGALSSEHHVQKFAVADGIFMALKQGPRSSPGRVICRMQMTGRGILGASVSLQEKPEQGPAGTSIAMLKRPAAFFRTHTSLSQPAADSLATDLRALALREYLDEVGDVELGVDIPVKHQNPLADFCPLDIGGPMNSMAMGQTFGS
jgi:hypothetical protein